MRKEYLTDAQVEAEIERLNDSPYVQLARKDLRIRYRLRQYLSQLRWLEKKGKCLADAGVTMETLEEMVFSVEGDDE